MFTSQILPVLLVSLCGGCALSAALLASIGDSRSKSSRRAVAVRLAQVALVTAGVLGAIFRAG